MVAARRFDRHDRLPLDNNAVARRLEQAARILEAQRASLYRVRAYRTAAATLRALDRPAVEILREGGRRGLQKLPGVGARLAEAIEQLVLTGQVHGLGSDASRS